MINLLPLRAKEHLAKERLARLLLVVGAIIAIILCIGFLLLWIPWVTLTLQERELAKQLDAVERSPLLARVQEIETKLSSLNGKLDAYERNRADVLFTSHIIESLLRHKNPDITISSISYTVVGNDVVLVQVRIEGIAKDRKSLLSFNDALDADLLIERVRSPISNFLEESDIEFALTFEAVPSLLHFPDIR